MARGRRQIRALQVDWTAPDSNIPSFVDPEFDYFDLGDLVDELKREQAAPSFPKTAPFSVGESVRKLSA